VVRSIFFQAIVFMFKKKTGAQKTPASFAIYVFMMRLPAARFRTRPFPPFPFAARRIAAAIRVPLVFFMRIHLE